MKLKSLLFLAVPFLMATAASAQDRIFQSNGNVIKARIVSVGAESVTYKLFSHPDGPEYSMVKNEIDKIKYESGKQEWFTNKEQGGAYPHSLSEPGAARTRSKMMLDKHMLSFAPLQLTEQGFGFAISYEQAIDKEGIVSFNLPLLSTFNLYNNSNYGYNYPNYYNNTHQDAMFYFCPGLKFYPTSMFGKLKYSVGPSIVAGFGQETTNDIVQPYSSYMGYNTYDRLVLGVMITNSLNINPTNHFSLGIDYGLGFTYLNRLNNTNESMASINQFAFRMGYRF